MLKAQKTYEISLILREVKAHTADAKPRVSINKNSDVRWGVNDYLNTTPSSAEVLRTLLYRLGVKQEEIFEIQYDNKFQLSMYFRSLKKARRLQNQLSRMNLRHVSLMAKSLSIDDWQSKWKDELKPFRLTKGFDVVPTWHAQKYKSKRRSILIGPGMAFGTGLHPTTRFIAQMIEGRSGKLTTVLDVGTGSGLLSILSVKHGAGSVVAIDICRTAVDVALENLDLNGIKDVKVIKKDIGKFNAKTKFNFVVANLTTYDLIDQKRKIVSLIEPEGFLGVSGISAINYSLFRKKFNTPSLRCLRIYRVQGWVGVLFKKCQHKK